MTRPILIPTLAAVFFLMACAPGERGGVAEPSTGSTSTVISGVVPDEGELAAALAKVDEVVIDDLRGLPVKVAMDKLGVPDRVPAGYKPEPILFAVPTDVGTSLGIDKSSLIITAAAVSNGVFYFGVIDSKQLSRVEGLESMLQSRAPMTLGKPGRAMWYQYKESLLLQAGVNADSVVALPVSKRG